MQLYPTQKQIMKRIETMQKRSNASGRPYTLSYDQVKQLMSERYCAYTGNVMTLDEGQNKLSIERVDVSRGYEPGNVVAITTKANKMRSDYDNKKFRSVIRRSIEGNKSRMVNIQANKAGIAKSKAKLERQQVALQQLINNYRLEEQKVRDWIQIQEGMNRVIDENRARDYMTTRNKFDEFWGKVKSFLPKSTSIFSRKLDSAT